MGGITAFSVQFKRSDTCLFFNDGRDGDDDGPFSQYLNQVTHVTRVIYIYVYICVCIELYASTFTSKKNGLSQRFPLHCVQQKHW